MMYQFDFIQDMDERIVLEYGFTALSDLELWEWIKNTNSDNVMSHNNTLNSIFINVNKKIQLSNIIISDWNIKFNIMMKQLKYIADNGESLFRSTYLSILKKKYEKNMEQKQHEYLTNESFILARL